MGALVVLGLLFVVGSVLLAHYMGMQTGYEHGYVDAEHDILCVECRMRKLEVK
jgi:hypothetical protein